MRHLKISNDRRVTSDRRIFSYAAYVPERRVGMDRRAMKKNQRNRKVVG